MSEQVNVNQLERLVEIGIALSSETDDAVLLEKILLGAKALTYADGGTLYLVKGRKLATKFVHSDSLNIMLSGSSESGTDGLPSIPLYLESGDKNLNNVTSYVFHNKKTSNIPDVYDSQAFDFSGPRLFDQKNNYRTQSLLTLPMTNHEGDVIGVLQLINARDSLGQVTEFSFFLQKLAENLASQAAVVLTKQYLIQSLAQMFDSLVQLIATAIDDKSPYTGGHCRRVPELTMLLAEAAHNKGEGYLQSFVMSGADRYELQVAAWLHDCGKITTPEYVIDKATKLETIFDRIQLVEARFEVLKRDCNIVFLEQKLLAAQQGKSVEVSVELQHKETLQQLADDFDFIKRSNTGGEFMSEADCMRIRELAKTEWQLKGENMALLSTEEVENLTIAKGTLTPDERSKINEHIATTIAMLEKIPFPKHLSHVVEYAGGHHERMDGRGYPKGLMREQMSVSARIMGIADVFEALTAKDRPYKDGKKLSEALSILEKMKQDNHIDPDLYDVFIEGKVYAKYAEKFLDKEQIDVE